MKKKLLAGLLAVAMVATMFAGCGKKEEKVINVMSFTDEIPKMVQQYLDMHPELGYTMKETIVATTNQEYQPALDEMLKGDNAPDIYGLEAAFVLKYTQGDAAGFAALVENKDSSTGRHIKRSTMYVKLLVEELKDRGYEKSMFC